MLSQQTGQFCQNQKEKPLNGMMEIYCNLRGIGKEVRIQ